MFPSPAGSSCFSILRDIRQWTRNTWVSVPCGVFVFLNQYYSIELWTICVSVPCGVFVFLNKDAVEIIGHLE